MNLKDFSQSKMFKNILYGIGIAVLVFLIFQAGMLVGFWKAEFSYRWGENYYRTFGGPRSGMMGMPRDDFSPSYGVVGKIIKITLPTFVIEGLDTVEKIVLITDDTAIRQLRESIKPADLKVNDFVVVIGSPDDTAHVEAKLIRLMPPPAGFMMGSTTKAR